MTSIADRLARLSPEKQALLKRALAAKNKQSGGALEVIVARQDQTAPVRLTFAQQRLWFLGELEGSNATYNMPIAVRLQGPLDRVALQDTLQIIVDRHEALRTTIFNKNGEPRQKVSTALSLELPKIDLSSYTGAAQDTRLAECMRDEAEAPFNLSKDPLIRAQLVELSTKHHVLLITMHHIISDGWSLGRVFLNEFIQGYDALMSGKTPDLAPLPIQYADYAVWQEAYLKGQRLEKLSQYWQEKLQGLPPLLELPSDHPRPVTQTHNGAVHHFRIDASLLHQLKQLAQNNSATLFMVLLAGYACLLGRYSHQDDFAIGSPVAGRNREELEPLIGLFINSLALRMQPEAGLSVTDFIQQVRQTCLDAFRHQEMPFERLVELIRPERNTSFSPLFQVMFILQNQNSERGGLRIGETEISSIPVDAASAMFDITLKLEEQGGELLGELEFNTDLFERATIEKMMDYLRVVWQTMATSPELMLEQISLSSVEETARQIQSLRSTQWPEYQGSLLDRVAEQARKQPRKLAIHDGAHALNYAELMSEADRLARTLYARGLYAEQRIGVCLQRQSSLLIVLLGVLRAGCAYVPIDPSFPADRIHNMATQGKLSLLIVDDASTSNLDGIEIPRLHLSKGIESPTHEVELPTLLPEQLAYIIFTSGSTGRPKGVQITHAALMNFLLSMLETPGLHSDDRLAAVTTISFDISGLELFLPLLAGASIELIDRNTAMDGYALLERLKACGATVMQATPATWRMLLATGTKQLPVTRCFCGGEALDAELATALGATGVEVWNLYGPTETTIWSSVGRVQAESNGSFVAPDLGHAIAGTSLYILDDALNPCGIGIPGELYIGGLGLSRGYTEQPLLTAERFLPDPFGLHAGARMYKTGDLVVLRQSGRLEYIGRADFQIKLRGYRIELGEIEAVLKTNNAVQHAVAITREIGSEEQLVAYVETKKNWIETLHTDNAQSENTTQQWQQVWDETYRKKPDQEAALSKTIEQDDFSGWLRSANGQPMTRESMTLWADTTAQRILQLQPTRVLEIGCGTGILAHRLVGQVAHYTGIDFSEQVLQQTQDRLARAGHQNFSLIQATADAVPLDQIEIIDTLVINSVAQYFPSLEYLKGVLDRLEPKLAPYAAVFLGDLRNLTLLELFHTRIALFQTDASMRAQDFLQMVSQASSNERELLFAPTAFAHWHIADARTTRAEIQLKPFGLDPELADFRYDLTLHLDEEPGTPENYVTLPVLAANPEDSIASLAQAYEQHPEGFRITGLYNSRLAQTMEVLAKIKHAGKQNMPELLAANTDKIEVGTDSIIAYQSWAEKSQLNIRLGWDAQDVTRIQALVTPKDSEQSEAGLWLDSNENTAEPTNHPSFLDGRQILSQTLMEALRQQLPSYMLPSSLIVLDNLPLTPNGKIDRAALPAPDRSLQRSQYVAPSTAIETAIAQIWADILGINTPGIHNNFFQLGGHSLLAVQVIARLRDLQNQDIPLQLLFDAPTISELSARLEKQSAHSDSASAPLERTPITVQSDEQRQQSPLTHQQRQLWFLDQLHGQSPTYHVSSVVRIHGSLNIPALKQSLRLIVERHQTLRTNFRANDEGPLAFLNEQTVYGWTYEIANTDTDINNQIQQALIQPFDLEKDPLLRCHVLQASDQENLLMLSLHHIIADEWSLALLQQELATFYPVFARGETPHPPALGIQYADYSVWRNQQNTTVAYQKSEEFWKKNLADAPPLLELPSDRPRPAQLSNRGALHSFTVDSALAGKLKTLAIDEGVTLFMTLLTGWSTLLARRANVKDLVLGVPISDRSRPELENLIGFFVNTLPLRINLSGNPTVSELLQRVRSAALQVMTHQAVPFDRILELIQPERNLSHAPVYQAVFVLQNAPKAELGFGDLTLELVANDAGVSKFDITLSVEEERDELSCVIEYSTELFDQQTIEDMASELKTLWLDMATTPKAEISALRLLEKSRLTQLLALPNPPLDKAAAPSDPLAYWRKQVRTHPDQDALVCDRTVISQRTLDLWSDQIAEQIRQIGLPEGSVIGIHAEPSPTMVAILVGILKTGHAYLPLVPDTPKRRLVRMLEIANCTSVFDTTNSLIVTGVQTLTACSLGNQIDQIHATPEPIQLPDATACIIFTSGSTGEPKAVSITYANLAASVAARLQFYTAEMSGLLLLQPFNFDVATGSILWALNAGGRLYLEPRATALDPTQLLMRIEQTRVSHLALLPLLYQPVLAMAQPAQIENLRCVLVGGEAMPAELAKQHYVLAPQAALYNEYGPTETTIMCAGHRVDPDSNLLQQPIGKALGWSRLYVLDERLSPVPIGVTGELCIGGPQVSLGYLGQAGVTAEKFVPDPFSNLPGARLYRSGDRARILRNGDIELQGRDDDQVKIRGHRIELGEVERALIATTSVIEATVRAVDIGISKILAAYVVLQEPVSGAETLLRAGMGKRLPDYMLPQIFVFLEKLPRTANGKLDHKALPEIKTESSRSDSPVGETEKCLSAIWCQVLGQDHVSRNDNFFALGGDSILCIQVVSRARQQGLTVSTKQLFEYQTIADLAPVVQNNTAPNTAEIAEPAQFKPLPIQQWFLQNYAKHPHYFNQSLMLRISSTVNDEALRTAVAALSYRHPALRLRAESSAQKDWVLRYADNATLPFESIQLSDSKAITATAESIQASLNIHEGPIGRVVRFVTSTTEDRLLIVVHHLAIDGVSWRILLQDLSLALASKDTPSTKTQIGMASWSAALDNYPIPSAHREYWRSNARLIPLPLDQQADISVVNQHGDEITLEFFLPENLSNALIRTAPEALNSSVQDLLLTALHAAFARWSGNSQLGLTLESHGRPELIESLDLSSAVGWFTASYPLLLDVDVSLPTAQRLRLIREMRQQVPLDGIEFGLLRYRDPDAGVRAQLAAAEHQPVVFNYLGQFESGAGDGIILGDASDSAGKQQSLHGTRPHLIDINGYFNAGRFVFFWSYAPALHHEKTIRALAASMQRELEALVAAASTPKTGDAWVPSDFPMAHLDWPDLEALHQLQSAHFPHAQIRNVFPLTPMQQGMLFHSKQQDANGAYIVQFSCDIHGALKPGIFQAAWQKTLDRHDALRIAILDLEYESHQVITAGIAMPWSASDWRSDSTEEQERNWRALLSADRTIGFDTQTPPLMRCTLIQMHDDSWRLLWSQHHVISDGWCLPIILSEVLQIYRTLIGETRIPLPPAPEWERYIHWLAQQDIAAARTFWRTHLQDLKQPSRIGWYNAQEEIETFENAVRFLDTEHTDALNAFARAQQTTLSALVELAIGVLVGAWTKRQDVMFGTTVSGRSAEIDGVEHMVGMFINSVAVRLNWSTGTSIQQLLSKLQQHQRERITFEFLPVTELNELAGFSPREIPFDCLCVFENYPVDESLSEPNASLQFGNVQALEQTNLPATLTVQPGETLLLSLKTSNYWFEPGAGELFVSGLKNLLSVLPKLAQQTVADWIQVALLDLNSQLEALRPERPDLANRATPSKDKSVYLAPLGESEQYIADLYANMLDQERVGRDDDFFDLGGHSLLAGRLASRLSVQFGLDISVRTVFEYGSVRQLAQYIDNQQWATSNHESGEEEHEEFLL